jgi:23S rRNA (uracil1939-C5)-methyltransferase
MGRRKRSLPLVKEMEFIDAASEGKAVGKYNEKVVFVPFVVPGDVADVQLIRKKKSFLEGKATHIHKYSDRRAEPKCEHFGVCGGCKWQNMKYADQLYFKKKQVVEGLRRIGKIEVPEIRPILGSAENYFYRNKLEYTFSNMRWLTEFSKDIDFANRNMNGLGFHIPKMWDRILDIENCYLQPNPSNEIRLAVKKYADDNNLEFYDVKKWTGFLRNLIIRNTSTGEWMVILVVREDDKEKINGVLSHLAEKFPEITSLMYVVNPKTNDTIYDLDVELFKGQPFIMEEMEGLRFKIGPKSFYQTNSKQAYELYKVAREFANLQGDEIVYDLYTGTGTIANFVASKAKKVIGIESVEMAIEDAKENSQINNIENTDFFVGDMLKVLDDEFIGEHGSPDVIITDPPRAGMHEKVVRQIIKAAPKKIVYVSCNPAPQARDAAILSESYIVLTIQPVDMFPHTQHVENVMLLERKPVVSN